MPLVALCCRRHLLPTPLANSRLAGLPLARVRVRRTRALLSAAGVCGVASPLPRGDIGCPDFETRAATSWHTRLGPEAFLSAYRVRQRLRSGAARSGRPRKGT